MKQPKTIEVSRSYGRKIKTDVQYEMRDFFASRKAECSPEDAKEISEWLYQECVKEVEEAVAKFQNPLMVANTPLPTYYDPEANAVFPDTAPKQPPKISKFRPDWCSRCQARPSDPNHTCDKCAQCGTLGAYPAGGTLVRGEDDGSQA